MFRLGLGNVIRGFPADGSGERGKSGGTGEGEGEGEGGRGGKGSKAEEGVAQTKFATLKNSAARGLLLLDGALFDNGKALAEKL